jgi:hypothetical protein
MSENPATETGGREEVVDDVDDGGGKWEPTGNGKKGTKKKKQGGEKETAVRNNLKTAGAKQIETREIAVTTVMLEFNIASGTSQVNPRPKHIEFCKLIQAIDPDMVMESAINATTWNSPNELPLATEYQKHFNVQDRNPPYKARKIVVHFTMKTKYRVNFLKHEPTVMKYLKANNMWFVLDKFQMQKVSRVGSMIEIHPDLVWKRGLTEELIYALCATDIPKAEITKWKKRTGNEENDNDMDEDSEHPPVPEFTLQSKSLAFGGLLTKVIQIECAEPDALYLKSLFAACASQEQFCRGAFLPQGLHLMTNPDTYKHLIADQNEFLSDIINIPVIGLPDTAFDSDHTNEAGDTLKESIHNSELFVGIEKTNRTHDLGKFHFLTCKDNEEAAAKWIDQELPAWVHKFVPEEQNKTGFDHPKRTAITFASPGLLLYAAQLQKDVKERDRPVNKDFMKAPDTNKRRRTYLEVSFGKEDFPAISTNNKKQTQNKKRQDKEKTETTEESTENGTKNKNQEEKFKEILRKSEEQFTKTLEATNESFSKRLGQVQESIQKNIEALQVANEAGQAAHKLEMSILRSAMLEFQEVQRIQNNNIANQLTQLLNKSGGIQEQATARVEEVHKGQEKRAKTGDPISTDEAHPALDTRLAPNPGSIVPPGGIVNHMYGMPANPPLAASMAARRMYQQGAYGGPAYPPPQMTPLQQQQQQRQYEAAYGLPGAMEYRNDQQIATTGYAAQTQAPPVGLVT